MTEAQCRALYDAARARILACADPAAAPFAARLPAHPGAFFAVEAAMAPGRTVLVEGLSGVADALLAQFQRHAATLGWRQSYDDSPALRSYLAGSGYVELLGQRGIFHTGDVAFGLGVIGPRCFYPPHRHPATELYLPIAGRAEWLYDNGPWVAHRADVAIVTQPNQLHAIRTTQHAVALLYVWLDGDPAVVSTFE